MLKAKSAECRQPTTLNDHDIFRLKQKAWIEDGALLLTKYQWSMLGKDDFETVQKIGNKFYGKGAK